MMMHDMQKIRSMKSNGKGAAQLVYVISNGDILSGYMYPKLHRVLRQVDRARKRKMHYE